MEFTKEYAEGFCKAAEECGVDPVALCKAAGVPNMYRLANLGKTIMNTASKYIPRAGSGANNGMMGTLGALSRASTSSPAVAGDLAAPRTVLHNLVNMHRASRLRAADDYFASAFPNGVPQQYKSVLDNLRSVLLKRPAAQVGYETPHGSWTEGYEGARQALSRFGDKHNLQMPAWVGKPKNEAPAITLRRPPMP